MSGELAQRRDRVAALFAGGKVDSLLVTALVNVRYLSGFTGSNGAVLLTGGEALLFTDPRYAIQAPIESDCRVRVVKGPLLKEAAKVIKRRKLKKVGIEAGHFTVHQKGYLDELLPLGASLRATAGFVEKSRMIKSAGEAELIRQAVRTNSEAFEMGMRQFKPGMKEFELAAEIEYQMRRLGGEKPSFETIVATGVHSALPHAHPTAEPIGVNQLLLIDMGTTRAGYTSDMTRTVFVGQPGSRVKRLYAAVLEAQLAAIAAVRPGVKAGKVDAAARAVLEKSGLEKAFVHSTGHGLGLEIHEPPRLGRKEATRLEPGMTITIEPGVYMEGEGGIRIEDTVLVTETGCEILTPTKKEFLAI